MRLWCLKLQSFRMNSFNPYATKRKAVKNSVVPAVQTNLLDLPYHIITDILHNLPIECLLQCQLASKLLEILITAPSFIRTPLAPQSTCIIVAQSFSESSDIKKKFYFIDEQATKVTKATLKLDFPYMPSGDPIMLYDSYDGFLLLKNTRSLSRSIFVIWNPTTKEQVTITMKGLNFNVCGFYFNTHTKEYEVLLVYENSGRYDFDILSLRSKSRRNIGKYSYMPRSERPPTIVSGTLYWMVARNDQVDCSNLVMAFEIRTNKFSTMQHGVASCNRNAMHLIEMEGLLGLCDYLSSTSDLVIWVLNPATNSCVKTHTVTLPNYSMPKYFSYWPNSLDVEVVKKMKDGKLLLRQMNRLLLCDLDLNTHEIVEKKRFENDILRPVIHTHTLICLGTDKLIQLDSERD